MFVTGHHKAGKEAVSAPGQPWWYRRGVWTRLRKGPDVAAMSKGRRVSSTTVMTAKAS